MDKELKSYLDKQFKIIHNKLEEHDQQFIKIDEHFEALTEAVNAGTKNFDGVKREIAVIKNNIREKLGVDI